MPLIALLSIAVQAFFIYHVFKTGRPYWWAFIILSFPIGGSLIYYLIEIFPNSREHRSARKTVQGLVRNLQPDAELKRRAEELEICGSMDNKIALAEECEAVGMYAESARLYASCLTGAYSNDAEILFRLAKTRLMLDMAQEVPPLLNQLETNHPGFKPQDVKLLQARVLEKTDPDAALAVYERLVPIYTGLEAKCRYGALLKTLGHQVQARTVFEEVIQHAKRFNIQHEIEREWVRFARSELRD